MYEKTVLIPNISCGHCVAAVQMEVSEIDGVKLVIANEDTKQAFIQWDAPATWDDIEARLIEIEYPAEDIL